MDSDLPSQRIPASESGESASAADRGVMALEAVLEGSPGLEHVGHGHVVGETADERLIRPGKVGVAQEYVELGFNSRDHIDPTTGMLRPEFDVFHARSRYFVSGRVADGGFEFFAMARQIGFDPELGTRSFPLTDEEPIDGALWAPIVSGEASGTKEISELITNPRHRAAGRRAIDAVYRSMFHAAVREGQPQWLMAARPTLFLLLERRFTPRAIRQIAEPRQRPGEDAIPAIFDVERVPYVLADEVEAAQASSAPERATAVTRRWKRYLDGLTPGDFEPELAARLVTLGLLTNPA